MSFNSAHYFQPVFTLNTPINIPSSIKEKAPNMNEYPIKIEFELFASVQTIDFDILFIYDEV
jgi:hypothetical protein